MPAAPPSRSAIHIAVVASPLGPLTLAATAAGMVGVHFERRRHAPPWHRAYDAAASGDTPAPVTAVLEAAGAQLAEYFARRRTAFDLPLAAEGTAFQMRVWDALRAIPFGETMSYAALARRVGDAGAARAVGSANGRNPVSIIVPCHRVVGSSGDLTGYGGGMERKRWRLVHEGALPGDVLGSGSSGSPNSGPGGPDPGPF